MCVCNILFIYIYIALYSCHGSLIRTPRSGGKEVVEVVVADMAKQHERI